MFTLCGNDNSVVSHCHMCHMCYKIVGLVEKVFLLGLVKGSNFVWT